MSRLIRLIGGLLQSILSGSRLRRAGGLVRTDDDPDYGIVKLSSVFPLLPPFALKELPSTLTRTGKGRVLKGASATNFFRVIRLIRVIRVLSFFVCFVYFVFTKFFSCVS